jgi:hypothetical protein
MDNNEYVYKKWMITYLLKRLENNDVVGIEILKQFQKEVEEFEKNG